MTELLTDAAVRAAVRGATAKSDHFEGHQRRALEYALHYHANEGREAVTQAVAEEIDNSQSRLDADELENAARAVVWRLFGPPDTAALEGSGS